MTSLAWNDLLDKNGRALRCCGGQVTDHPVTPRWILPGSFNPFHHGHRRMAAWVQRQCGQQVEYELSVVNVDKPPLVDAEISRRLRQFDRQQPIWLTRAATFVEKSQLFAGGTFLMGVDTFARIIDSRYYTSAAQSVERAIRQFRQRGCRFIVFGRRMGDRFVSLSHFDLPPLLADLCREVPATEFREDISATELRRRSGASE